MNKSYNSKLDVSSHPIPEQYQVARKQGDNMGVFDPQQILYEISTHEEISIPQLQSQMKEMKLNLNQLILDLGRVKKDVFVRPTLTKMMQNTILITSMIQADPNIMKLLKSRQDQIKNEKRIQIEQDQFDKKQKDQLKQLSFKFGNKLSNINDGLSVLYLMFKQLQKQQQSQMSQMRSFLEQKIHSIQDQINLMKIEQISQRTSMTQKFQSQFQTIQQKLRLLETKQTWEIKQLKNKLNEKLDKQIFQKSIQQTLQESKKMFRDFCQSSKQLVSPQKINELQLSIKENRQKLIKEVTQCNMKVDLLGDKMVKQLVGVEFYRKQRTSIQKRLSTININFSQIHQKVTTLLKDSLNHQNRLCKLQTEMLQKTKTIKQMRATLRSLSITEQFQQMLAQIDPQKILSFQNKITQLQDQNKQVYKMFAHINEEIDKINSKFDISGVLVPNQSRQKEYQLNNLKSIIDQYFVQNRYAHKISKLQSDINQGKTSVQTIKLLQKKVSRLQKQSQFNKIIQQFNLLQQKIKKQIKILTQKLQTRISQIEVQKSYIQGLFGSTVNNKPINNTEQSEQFKIKLLMTESRSRIVDRQTTLQHRYNSLRKISLWQASNKNNNSLHKNTLNNSRIAKNTISSARKSLLTSNNLMLAS